MRNKSVKDFFIKYEGKRATVYDDATGKEIHPGTTVQGNPTIGIGCNLLIPLAEYEIDYLFGNRLANAELDLSKALGRSTISTLSDDQLLALTSMMFQLGYNSFCGFVNMIAAIKQGDMEKAHMEALNSKWARNFPARASEISKMLLRY